MLNKVKIPVLPKKILIIIITAALAVLIPFAVYSLRSPVLILSEESFTALYGEKRIRKENIRNSIALFRRVLMVKTANDAGEDIIPHAVAEISSSPYCVLFPLRFTRSARLYKEQNPGIPVILLEGRRIETKSEFDFSYKTDIENDFFQAGIAALELAAGGKIAVFLESSIDRLAREAFLRGIGEEKASEVKFYTNFSHYHPVNELSCAVLAGIGAEFMEGNVDIPVIYISWLNPGYVPQNVVMIINDSPLAQVKEAVRLFSAGEKEGKIRSNFLTVNSKKIDKKILRKIKKIR